MDIQQVILAGTIVNSPKVSEKELKNVLVFTLMCYRRKFKKGNDETDVYINYYSIFKSFDKGSAFADHFHKGQRVLVYGEPFVEEQENRNMMVDVWIAVRADKVFIIDHNIDMIEESQLTTNEEL